MFVCTLSTEARAAPHRVLVSISNYQRNTQSCRLGGHCFPMAALDWDGPLVTFADVMNKSWCGVPVPLLLSVVKVQRTRALEAVLNLWVVTLGLNNPFHKGSPKTNREHRYFYYDS